MKYTLLSALDETLFSSVSSFSSRSSADTGTINNTNFLGIIQLLADGIVISINQCLCLSKAEVKTKIT